MPGGAPMRIAIDARELTGRPTGVGRYLAALLDQWAESPAARDHQWCLYAHREPPRPDARWPLAVLPGDGGTRWEQWTLARRLAGDRPGVLFAPAYTAPLRAPCPVVLTVHDVSFAAHPEWFRAREGIRRRLLTRWSAGRARTVLTDSAFSRDELMRRLGVAPEKVRVIPLGVTRRTRAAPDGNEKREPIILFVGALFRRRHVDRLIDAFVHSVAERVPASRLEIVGEDRCHPPLDFGALVGQAARPSGRVSLRSFVDEHVLSDLYARASVFAFLSEYEGFGLTPLEALAAGIPPLVFDTPVAREVYGSAARYMSVDASREVIADALVDLLTNPASREAILARAADVLARYDWACTARLTLDAIVDSARE
jgi:glycosyltransferase involved in cell wall biosynthesis